MGKMVEGLCWLSGEGAGIGVKGVREILFVCFFSHVHVLRVVLGGRGQGIGGVWAVG